MALQEHGVFSSRPSILSWFCFLFNGIYSAGENDSDVLFSRAPQAEEYLPDASPPQACFFLPGAQDRSRRSFPKPDLCQPFSLQPRELSVLANHQNLRGLQGERVSHLLPPSAQNSLPLGMCVHSLGKRHVCQPHKINSSHISSLLCPCRLMQIQSAAFQSLQYLLVLWCCPKAFCQGCLACTSFFSIETELMMWSLFRQPP